MTRKAKILVSFACIVLIAVIIQLGLFFYSQYQVKNIHRQEAYANEVYQQIDVFFVDRQSGFIVEDLTEDDLVNIQTFMSELEESMVLSPKQISAYNDLHRRYFARREVNSMYVEPVIIGELVKGNIPFIDNIEHSMLQQEAEPYRFEEPEDYYQETINLLIDDGLSQTLNYELALSKLNNLGFIPIELGYFEAIARGLKEAEEAYALVYNQTLVNKLNEAFQTYAISVVKAVNASDIDILNNQELKNAMEISPYLKRLFASE